MLPAQPGEQGVAREDGRREGRGVDIGGAVADIGDEVAGGAIGGGVGELEPLFDFDAAGAVVTRPPAVVRAGATGVARDAIQPEVVEHRLNIEVEAVRNDRQLPAVPVRPIVEGVEAEPRPGCIDGESGKLGARYLYGHEVQRAGVVLLDGEFAAPIGGFELAPAGLGEPFEELPRKVVRDDRVVEVERQDSGHATSIAPVEAGYTRLVDYERARYLVSAEGRAALAALDPALGLLPVNDLAARLRRLFAPAAAAALGEQLTLRARARSRWGEDAGLLLTGPALEMMTHPLVAKRRAARLAAASGVIVDLTCGSGGDLRAFAEAGARAVGVERDGPTAMLAAANVPAASVVRGEAEAAPFALAGRGVFLDPSRRAGGGRTFDPAAFTPPWSVVLACAREAGVGVVKAPPGLDHQAAPPEAELEFVQLGRSMREATLWLGGDARPGLRRAVLLPGGVELDSEAPAASGEPVPPGPFVFDPESCVTRAGVVRQLAYQLGARLVDPAVAYLSGPEARQDALAATFAVLAVVPFSLSRLRQLLRERHWSPREVRRRAFPVEPEELRRLLGPLEGEPVTLLCTTIGGRRTIIIARRVGAQNCEGG